MKDDETYDDEPDDYLEALEKQTATTVWRTKIPKKLYNKIKYYLSSYGVSRDYFLSCGVDNLQLKFNYNADFPDADELYRFDEKAEADLVTWQVKISVFDAENYEKFRKWYDLSGRDLLAAALYGEKEGIQ